MNFFYVQLCSYFWFCLLFYLPVENIWTMTCKPFSEGPLSKAVVNLADQWRTFNFRHFWTEQIEARMEEEAVVNENVHISHCVDPSGMDGSRMCVFMVRPFTDWLICFSNMCLAVEGRLFVFCFPLCRCLHQTSPRRFNIHKAFKWKAVFSSVIKKTLLYLPLLN